MSDNVLPIAGTGVKLLPLGSPRTIRLTIAKQPVTFTFAPIGGKTWRKFLEQVVTRVEQKGDQSARIMDEDSALLWLFDETSDGVEGYKGSEGLSASVRLGRVPLKHRIAAASVLRAVGVRSPAEETLSEFTEVVLNTPWSANEAGDMEMFDGLIHRFRQPTIEQYRRWKLGVSRVQVSGTAEDSVAVYPSRLAVALGLYDELIAEVEGYTFNGVLLATPADIAAHMDGMHKAVAVRELFERGEEEIAIGALPTTVENDDDDAEAAAA